MAKKSYEYQGHVFEDNGHGDLYNGELDRFLIFRPYPMMVQTIIHKDNSVTMNQEKFKENSDENKGVYEEGYEINEDGSVFVKAEDVDPKIKEESEDNKNTISAEDFQSFKEDMKNSLGNLGVTDISFADEKGNSTIEKDNVQHEYTSYFTLESPLGDIDAAQEYLSEDNMAQYLEGSLKEKVDSIDWVLDDDQSGHIEIKTNSTLTDQEQKDLEDWIDGQNSDGLGEGFEQQDFANAYFNPDDGDGPFTYNEAEQEIDNIIENVDEYDAFDYIDESEIEAAVDTYLEDNDLITEFKDNNWDSVKDELFSYCSTDQIVEAAETIKGEELTDEEMDLVYDNFDSDPDYKEEIAQELWQNLATYEQGEVVNALDQGETLREEARDAIRDDIEGYIPDDVIWQAKEEYARDHYNIEIDDWGTMSSIRRSVDGLQDKVIEPERPLIDRINEEIADNYDSMQPTTWRDWVNENLDKDKTPSKIAQDYQRVIDNINQEINSYSNDDLFDIADSYLERNGITESNGYDTPYIMRLRNGIIESLHIDEDSDPRDFGVTNEDIELADQYDRENNRKSWEEIKSEKDLPMTQDEYNEFKRKLNTQENITFDEYRMGLAMDRYEKGYNANDLSYQDLKDIQDYRKMKELYEPKGQVISDRYIENPIISEEESYTITVDDGESVTNITAKGIDEARTIKDDQKGFGEVRIFDSNGGEIIEDKDAKILENAKIEYGYAELNESNLNDIASTGNRRQQEAAENRLAKIDLAKRMRPEIAFMNDVERRNLMRSLGLNYKSLNKWSGTQLYSILEKEINKIIKGE